MKNKALISVGVAVLCVLLAMSTASGAINFLSTDGFWAYIDSGYDGVRIDVMGVIGSDPASGYWGSGTKTTEDDTLIRIPTVCTHNSYGDASLSEFTGISPAVYTNLG